MKTSKQYNEMTQRAAYQITRALAVFDSEPDDIRQQAEQIIMQRVQLMRGGQRVEIDGDDLVSVAPEPSPEPEVPVENPTEDDPAP